MIKNEKILILGATGMLGFSLHRYLSDAGWCVTGTIRQPDVPIFESNNSLKYVKGVDVSNLSSVENAIINTSASVVINAVAVKTDNNNNALLINSIFPKNLSLIIKKLGIRLVHISSDSVFDGKTGNYDENSTPNPVDIYGMSKYLGEVEGSNILTLRTSIIGRSLYKNDSLVDWFLAQNGYIKGYRKSVFSGFPVSEICNIFSNYILPKVNSINGIYHLSSSPINKYKLLSLIKEVWNMKSIHITPDDSIKINRSLDSKKIKNFLNYSPRSWETLIIDMRDFYKNIKKIDNL